MMLLPDPAPKRLVSVGLPRNMILSTLSVGRRIILIYVNVLERSNQTIVYRSQIDQLTSMSS